MIHISNGVYKPTYNWGDPHCINHSVPFEEVYGGFQGHGGTPSYYHFFRIFHEIIHPAIGVPSILGSLHIASVEHIINHNGGYTD